MQLDPKILFDALLGPLGAFVLLLVIGYGFAKDKPWWYFAREMAQTKARVNSLESQNRILMTLAQSGTNQGTQAAELAKLVAALTGASFAGGKE